MPKKIDIIGQKINHLTILEQYGRTKHGMRKFKCLCDCGRITYGTIAHIMNGTKKSCGCIKFKYGKDPVYKSKLYDIWIAMNDRCRNPNNPSFKRYGGRGIHVCDEWSLDYGAFKDWAISNGYCEGLSIDRVDNSCGYSPDNCRWVSRKIQQNNMSSNRLIEFNGETKTLSQWAERLGIKPSTLSLRLKNWSLERALTEARHEECVRA